MALTRHLDELRRGVGQGVGRERHGLLGGIGRQGGRRLSGTSAVGVDDVIEVGALDGRGGREGLVRLVRVEAIGIAGLLAVNCAVEEAAGPALARARLGRAGTLEGAVLGKIQHLGLTGLDAVAVTHLAGDLSDPLGRLSHRDAGDDQHGQQREQDQHDDREGRRDERCQRRAHEEAQETTRLAHALPSLDGARLALRDVDDAVDHDREHERAERDPVVGALLLRRAHEAYRDDEQDDRQPVREHPEGSGNHGMDRGARPARQLEPLARGDEDREDHQDDREAVATHRGRHVTRAVTDRAHRGAERGGATPAHRARAAQDGGRLLLHGSLAACARRARA
ncbi:hypothetical protein GCM10025873_11890 [Demequina sediminis]|nr:hypothetical protein GCM10025873_11890 [Demequina sediminis]